MTTRHPLDHVATSERYDWMAHVMRVGARVYATDGYVIVSVPVDEYPGATTDPAAFVDVASIAPPSRPPDAQRGLRELIDWCPPPQDACPCGLPGCGRLRDQRPGRLLGVMLDRRLLAQALPCLGDECDHVDVWTDGPLGPVHLRAGDRWVAIMPVRSSPAFDASAEGHEL